MSSQYKQEERNLRKIISENIVPRQDSSLQLAIYYRNRKLSNLFIKNNQNKDTSDSHVVYKYKCSHEGCQPLQYYIGYTTTTLKQRMTCHTQSGSIQAHHRSVHNEKQKTAQLLDSTDVMYRAADKMELQIVEALYIKSENPPMNNQREGEVRILQVF